MLRIAICDDDAKIGADLECALTDIFSRLSVTPEIEVFLSGEKLCKAIDPLGGGVHYDLIFLDIEYAKNEINGVEVGRTIRDIYNNHKVSIVFMSREKSYALDLFDIQPFNFLIKPLNDEKINEVVTLFMKVFKLWAETLTYKISHETFNAKIKDIMYIESRNKKLRLHLVDGTKTEFYGSIKEVYDEQLKNVDFLFIHTSYVVNYDYINTLGVNQVLLIDIEIPLPMSKHRAAEVRKRFYEIMRKRRV